MKANVLRNLLTNYDENRIFKGDAYYAIKKLSDDSYALERTISGPCGESIYTPTIKVRIKEEQLFPYQLTDLDSNPIKLWDENKQADMEEALSDLIELFQEKSK